MIQFVDPESVSLRGMTMTAPDPQEAAVLPAVPLPPFKVSYVTNFWAQASEVGVEVESNPHRLEIRASLLANIHNPHFDQVVVFLDGVKEDANCPLFLDGLVKLSRNLGTTSFNDNDLYSKVTCVGSTDGQPNYYQMFQNAVSDHVAGDVVVMANADMVFDDTASLARHLNPEVLIALGSRGFSDKTPQHVKAIYDQIVGKNHSLTQDDDRCAASTRRFTLSFDSYIFHKSKLRGRLKAEMFQRPNIKGEKVHFNMNENGAECAALWALRRTYPFKSTYNPCEKIYSWSFHLTPKTHHVREIPWSAEAPEYVPGPWELTNKFPECRGQKNCFLVEKK